MDDAGLCQQQACKKSDKNRHQRNIEVANAGKSMLFARLVTFRVVRGDTAIVTAKMGQLALPVEEGGTVTMG